ncbi:hypothetical protein CC78DRAFT_583353 [Lojkania enalia]|uniref:Uncharacterized protein n=1 Tax=Lojkania enalia TaxID=147567 RepID=A0A9P4MXT6_9PLEO|nr:hypothetical protein CC78DRAFT_583353 [Didymosphaeria enalia]
MEYTARKHEEQCDEFLAVFGSRHEGPWGTERYRLRAGAGGRERCRRGCAAEEGVGDCELRTLSIVVEDEKPVVPVPCCLFAHTTTATMTAYSPSAGLALRLRLPPALCSGLGGVEAGVIFSPLAAGPALTVAGGNTTRKGLNLLNLPLQPYSYFAERCPRPHRCRRGELSHLLGFDLIVSQASADKELSLAASQDSVLVAQTFSSIAILSAHSHLLQGVPACSYFIHVRSVTSGRLPRNLFGMPAKAT